MANRTRTISYIFNTDTNTRAAAINTVWPPITVWVAEPTPAFTSVILELVVSDAVTAAADTTAGQVSLGLGTVAVSPQTCSITITAAGENKNILYVFDYTNYFRTNWTGTNMGCTASYATVGTNNVNGTGKLTLSYAFDDTSATTRTKTIYIPIESTGSYIKSGSWCELGGKGAIFASSSLPEAECSVKQSWVELWAPTGDGTVKNWTASLVVNRASALNVIDFHKKETTLATGLNCYAAITTSLANSAQLLEVSMSGQGFRLAGLGGMNGITYTYNHDTSTTIWNSILIPYAPVNTGVAGGDITLANAIVSCSQDSQDFYIQEPETITLQTSSLNLFYLEAQGSTLNPTLIACGAQTGSMTLATCTYYQKMGVAALGSFVHKIDNTGRHGTAFGTLKRGKNNLTTRVVSNTANGSQLWARNGYYLINYKSGKYTDGDGAHNHSVYRNIESVFGQTAGARNRWCFSASLSASHIPEDSYFITGIGARCQGSTAAQGVSGYTVAAGELFTGLGWRDVLSLNGMATTEEYAFDIIGDSTNKFQQWANSTETNKLSVKSPYSWRLNVPGTAYNGSIGFWTTYHTIDYTVSGTLTGYTGDGSGITVDVFRDSDDKKLLSLTSAVGGGFTGNWYDNTEDIYCVAYQDSTHLGRSDSGKPA